MDDRPTLPVPAGDAPADLAPHAAPAGPGGARAFDLPSGRRVLARADAGGESVEVRSPDGEMELRVTLTPSGPVLSLRGARLELAATESVALSCKSFELEARDGLALRTGGDLELATHGDLRSRASGQTWIDADYVNLNCGERTGYHDDPARAAEPGSPAPDGDADP